MRVFLIVAALIIVATMIEGYIAFIHGFTTPTIGRMPLTFIDERAVDPAEVAQTENGRILGRPHPNGVIQFHGIPFAESPIGALRFAAPRPADSWSGLLDGRGVGPRCMQEDNRLLGIWPGDQSEDCLWLSVSTPGVDVGGRPVIVWIHGGGFYAGGAGEDHFDAAHLAARGDVVEVNIQYRLGVFGWLDVSHLGGDEVAQSANNGQLDQLLALRWVRDNIQHFGGDPGNVTLMGTSAGSYAVASLLQLPEAESLFRRAILMSGVVTPGSGRVDNKEVAVRFMEYLDAGTLQDLRAVSSIELLDAQKQLAEYAMELGSPDLQTLIEIAPPGRDDFRRAGLSGKQILHGTTLHEYHMFTAMVPDQPDKERQLAYDIFGGLGIAEAGVDELAGVLGRHFVDRQEADLYIDALTAALMAYPHEMLTEEYGANGADVYRYLFAWTSTAFPELGAFHSLDTPYFFGTTDSPSAQEIVGDDVPSILSEEMMDAISSFARHGRPMIASAPDWPVYTDAERLMMRFDVPTILVEDPLPWLDEFSTAFETLLNTRAGY